MPAGNRWGPWRSLLALSPVLIGGPLYAYQQHFSEQAALLEIHFLNFTSTQNYQNLFQHCKIQFYITSLQLSRINARIGLTQ